MDDAAVMDRIIHDKNAKRSKRKSKPKAKARCDKRGLLYNGQKTKRYMACSKALGHKGDCTWADVTHREVVPAKKKVARDPHYVDLHVNMARRKTSDTYNYDYRQASSMQRGVADMLAWVASEPGIRTAQIVIMDKDFNRLQVIDHVRKTQRSTICPKQTCVELDCKHKKVTKVVRTRTTTSRDMRTSSVTTL